MRTDVEIDRRTVKLPYKNQNGFQKYKASPGDVVFFDQGPGRQCGRILGRINKGENLTTGESLKNFLVVACLSSNMQYCYERWVSPAEVLECYDIAIFNRARTLETLFDAGLLNTNTNDLRLVLQTDSQVARGHP